jgi:predicted nucleic acid-binding protein
MAASVLVDAGFIVALLSRRDAHHRWAVGQAERQPPPWKTCESVISEAFHLLGTSGAPPLRALLRRRALAAAFDFDANLEAVLRLMRKYADVPASLADASLVRMTEVLPDPLVLTTDADFRVYRRHGRQVVPCVVPT